MTLSKEEIYEQAYIAARQAIADKEKDLKYTMEQAVRWVVKYIVIGIWIIIIIILIAMFAG